MKCLPTTGHAFKIIIIIICSEHCVVWETALYSVYNIAYIGKKNVTVLVWHSIPATEYSL